VKKPAAITRRALLPIALSALFVLAGCGIKGPLELPADADANLAKEAKGKGTISQASRLPGYKPTAQEQKAAKQMGKPARPDQPFVLDSLLN
jgi:predicted small lipoprotein YifL